jgi:hypothetical protein
MPGAVDRLSHDTTAADLFDAVSAQLDYGTEEGKRPRGMFRRLARVPGTDATMAELKTPICSDNHRIVIIIVPHWSTPANSSRGLSSVTATSACMSEAVRGGARSQRQASRVDSLPE